MSLVVDAVAGGTRLAQSSSEVEAGEDLTGWLAEQWWTPFAMCAVFVAVGLWMIRSMVIHRGRDRQLRRTAEAAGMTFSEQDGHGISRTDFKHFGGGAGKGWTASNVMTHRGRDGLLTHGFDARSWAEYEIAEGEDGDASFLLSRSGSGSGVSPRIVRRGRGATRSAAVTELPINAPRLVIARENIASKLFAAATRVDLDVESEMFNRSYHVIGESRDFARALLDARVVDLMARTEGRVSFEFVGPRALLATVLLEPELVPGLVSLGEELRNVIPQLVIDRWPRAALQRTDLV